jgi:hypothetical protein
MFSWAAQVFTTCGSDKKRSYLLKTFPKLRDDHIGDSRSCSFEAMVMNQVCHLECPPFMRIFWSPLCLQ